MINFTNSINRILVTGGSGFIGGTLIRKLINFTNLKVFNLDKRDYLTDSNFDANRYQYFKIDLSNLHDTKIAINAINPDIVFHLAAESHVDRSITAPRTFLASNVIGTFNLLEALLPHWESLPSIRKNHFKFIHISTDEVFGSLEELGLFAHHRDGKAWHSY